MPIYEYVCRACGARFDEMRKMSERLASPACRVCASPRTALALSVPGRVGVAASSGPAETCELGDACCGGVCAN